MDGSERTAFLESAFVWKLNEDRCAALGSNYAFKPTAEQALGIDRGTSCRGGLTRR